eukprot:7896188-Lingulodinium_polyedra.AAC.1
MTHSPASERATLAPIALARARPAGWGLAPAFAAVASGSAAGPRSRRQGRTQRAREALSAFSQA